MNDYVPIDGQDMRRNDTPKLLTGNAKTPTNRLTAHRVPGGPDRTDENSARETTVGGVRRHSELDGVDGGDDGRRGGRSDDRSGARPHQRPGRVPLEPPERRL